MITFVIVIPDLYLIDLSLRLIESETRPLIISCLSATIGTVPQDELVLNLGAWLQIIDSDKVVVVAEHFESWEVSVLLLLDRQVRISESELELLFLTRDSKLSTIVNERYLL